ncbi:unnamed protein product [Staurois parvus]|uniref:Uncharacterized protein n=1 Tax=Staurois parvus TaxID=386267 RepID=A0ABN9EAE1_9NEOB|nr:unnamed protein product [Staurois parvus]
MTAVPAIRILPIGILATCCSSPSSRSLVARSSWRKLGN